MRLYSTIIFVVAITFKSIIFAFYTQIRKNVLKEYK